MRIKQWNVAETDKQLLEQLQQSTSLSTMVSTVLATRWNGSSVEEIVEFLQEDGEFESPLVFADMDKAVERVQQALENHQRIAIYGDYDCDGITSTAMLLHYFQSVGADVFYYIPDREKEGYGMNPEAVKKIADLGAKLIITVDNGVSAHQEIAYAAELGVDTVVTDHHTPRETLPPAVAVVNPHREDCPSRFKEYAGVGVAFQLLCALEQADPWELLEFYSDFVTLGTVADLVPLVGENRAIVIHGMTLLEQMPRVGVQALMEIAGVRAPLGAESISFGLAPRINAAGRMGQVEKAVELLTTDDSIYAKEIAESLQNLNMERRGTEDAVFREIGDKLRQNPELLLGRILLVWGEDWHPGVMGIVASRLTDRYGKPSIVFSVSNGEAKGSGRSLEGFSLIEAISACSQHLTHYGGHTLAAGMTLPEEHLQAFDEQLQTYAKEHSPLMPVPGFDIDAEISMKDLTLENIGSLDALEPFGAGNPSPIFVVRKVLLDGIFPTADQKHMRLRLKGDGQDVMAIYFRMTPARFPYKVGDRLDAVVAVDINEWNGNLQLSVKVQDLRPSDLPEQQGIQGTQRYLCHRREEYGPHCLKEDLLPQREELAVIYRYLQQNEGYAFGATSLWEELFSQDVDLGRLQVGLDAFEESGLICRDKGKISLKPNPQKVDLEQTKTFSQLVAGDQD